MAERVPSYYIDDSGNAWQVLVPIFWTLDEFAPYNYPAPSPGLDWLPKSIIRRRVTLASADRSVRYSYPCPLPWSYVLPVAGDLIFLVGIDGHTRAWYVRGRVPEKTRGRGARGP
jgi:hypothetical protein